MRKLLWVVVVLAVISFVVWSKNPLDETVNFIIGGSVPGTKIVLGFWPTVGLIIAILWLIHRGIKNARLKMMEDVTKKDKAAKAKAEFKEQNSSEHTFDHSKRSVIAAPQSDY